MTPTYKLSPSDFAYLYQDCKLCYYMKVKGGVYQPSMPMPGVFSAINTRIQGGLVGKNLKDLHKDFPDGQIINQEGWVESITVPGTSVFIKGKYDLLVKNPDGTHTMVDLKISQPHEDKVEKYQTQLWAYKYALEHPKTADPLTITKLALLIFYPDEVEFEDDSVEIDFPPKWLEVTINDEEFLKFMSEVNDLLTGPVPEENPDCKWCQYRRVSIPRSGITPT
jgi:CRISPR/Cas system-associated exonuclease Cas4 (RecB family)